MAEGANSAPEVVEEDSATVVRLPVAVLLDPLARLELPDTTGSQDRMDSLEELELLVRPPRAITEVDASVAPPALLDHPALTEPLEPLDPTETPELQALEVELDLLDPLDQWELQELPEDLGRLELPDKPALLDSEAVDSLVLLDLPVPLELRDLLEPLLLAVESVPPVLLDHLALPVTTELLDSLDLLENPEPLEDPEVMEPTALALLEPELSKLLMPLPEDLLEPLPEDTLPPLPEEMVAILVVDLLEATTTLAVFVVISRRFFNNKHSSMFSFY